MFMGYGIEIWIEIGEYLLFMSVLGLFIFCLSVKLTSIIMIKDKIKPQKKSKKIKKSAFIDVA